MAGENIGQIILGLDINQKFFNKKLNGILNGANRTVMGAFKPMGKMLAGALAVEQLFHLQNHVLN